MRIYCAVYVLAVLAIPVSGRSQDAAALLPSAEPLRRLGISEFRLPRRNSNERMFPFSPDGKLVAACNWDEVKVWTFPEGKLKHDFSAVIDSDCIAFSRDGRELLVLDRRGKEEKAIVRFDLASGRLIRRNALDHVRQEGATYYTFLDNGRWLCSVDIGSRLAVWDGNTGRLTHLKPSIRTGRRPVASNDVLTIWDRNLVERIDLRTGNQVTRFVNYMKRSDPICTPDGTLMAGYSTEDKAIVFWKTDTNELVGGKIPVPERQWQPSQAALTPDGKRLIYWTGTGDYFNRKIAVFDVETGDLISEFAPPDACVLEEPIVSPDGKWIFLSGERSVFIPVNAETGEPFRATPDHVQEIEKLSFTPDGVTLVVGSRDQRRAWNVTTGEPGTVFAAYYHIPYVAAADNRRAIVSGLRKGGLQLQDIATGEVERLYDLGRYMHLASFQLGADRKTFVGQAGPTFRRWDVETGDVLAEWTLPDQPDGRGMQPYSRYSFGGLVLGGSRLYRFDQVRPAKRLDDQSIDWGQYDLLLEDWTTRRVTNRLSIPYIDHFNVAEAVDDRTLAVVASDDWTTRASKRMELGSTYLIAWDVASGWERMRVTRPRPDYHSAFSIAAMTPDARLAATVRNRDQIEIWNGFTGKLIQQLDAPIDVSKLAFSDDGTMLASGHIEGSVYLWNASRAWNVAVPLASLDDDELQQCWDDLGGAAPAKALQCLLGDPEGAVKLLERNLQPVNEAPDIADVIDAENAEAIVRNVGSEALGALYEALEQSESEEESVRINRLIDVAARPVAAPLRRQLLAIGLAEKLSAKQALETMSRGAANATETRAAVEALRRLNEGLK